MKRTFLVIGLIVVLTSFNGTQQERRFNLSLTEQEINTVLQGLSELPMKVSQPVYSTIMQQAQAQLQPPKVNVPVQKDSTKPKRN